MPGSRFTHLLPNEQEQVDPARLGVDLGACRSGRQLRHEGQQVLAASMDQEPIQAIFHEVPAWIVTGKVADRQVPARREGLVEDRQKRGKAARIQVIEEPRAVDEIALPEGFFEFLGGQKPPHRLLDEVHFGTGPDRDWRQRALAIGEYTLLLIDQGYIDVRAELGVSLQ